jgi:hypothetical protein
MAPKGDDQNTASPSMILVAMAEPIVELTSKTTDLEAMIVDGRAGRTTRLE